MGANLGIPVVDAQQAFVDAFGMSSVDDWLTLWNQGVYADRARYPSGTAVTRPLALALLRPSRRRRQHADAAKSIFDELRLSELRRARRCIRSTRD